MRERPPPQLIALLDRLGVATAAQVERMESRVRHLARDLPCFESVWVDSLSHARVLTPFQAAEINAGRGDRLRVGPYVLRQPASACNYVACYRAQQLDSHESVRLSVIDRAGPRQNEILGQLELLVSASKDLSSPCVAPVTEVGLDGDRLWVASRWIEGPSAAEWMVHHGRFPPNVVLEIARAMLVGLVDLETHGLVHGDVGISGLLLTSRGEEALLQPGLRGIVRPGEGFAHADLRPEAYDSLAPERVSAGTPPTTASDVYACGCAWWHLLCGRSPLGGGDSLTRLRGAQAAAVGDLRQWAHEVPAVLADAVAACLQRDPNRRPGSMSQLASMLGPASRRGRQSLTRCLKGSASPTATWVKPASSGSRWKRLPQTLTAAAAALILVVAVAWPIWRSKTRSHAPAGEIGQVAERTARDAALSPSHPSDSRPISKTLPPVHREVAKAPRTPQLDTAVSPARFDSATSPSQTMEKPLDGGADGGVPDLVLPSDRATAAGSLSLRAGQRVRAEPGRRARLLVAPEGLTVKVDKTRFENIDFFLEHPQNAATDAAIDSALPADPSRGRAPRAIVRLCATEAEFHGCRFQSSVGMHTAASVTQSRAAPIAILWTHPVDSEKAALTLPSGRIRLRNCLFHDVGAAICARTVGALSVEVINTLHLGGGPLVQLCRCPAADEPFRMILSQVTLRDSGPLIECDCPQGEEQPGEISISATGCVLAPRSGISLLLIAAAQSPEPLLRNVKWTGQGSLVLPATGIAAWRRPDGAQQVQDDAAISIAGLVRSSVEFAGRSDEIPAGSRVSHWQAPLQSADDPGADVADLPNPTPPARRGP